MNWDIKPGRDQDYFEFVIHEWVPGVNRLGIETIAAWYTIYSRDGDVAPDHGRGHHRRHRRDARSSQE